MSNSSDSTSLEVVPGCETFEDAEKKIVAKYGDEIQIDRIDRLPKDDGSRDFIVTMRRRD